MLRFPCLLVFLLSGIQLIAQTGPDVTFGPVSDEDRALREAPGDPTAEAYVLFDRLSLDFEFNDTDGPSLTERHHRRVKLLKPSSFDRANITLEYNREYAEISEVEAFIHLPTGGTLPVPSDQIRLEKLNGTREAFKFTFPQVSEGAILEYRYLERRKNILIPSPYYFQEDIPVRWAQYDAMIPPYYRYVSLSAPRLDVNETKLTARAWGPRFNVSPYNGGEQKIDHWDILWAMRDLPSFRDQPYSNNVSDYLPSVRLQLQAVQYPGRPEQSIFGDWKETVKELQDRLDFGRYYRNKVNYSTLWKDAAPSITGQGSEREIIEAAYAFINQHISWNGDYGMLASRTPDQVYQSRTGTSADLNIALLSLLNEAGVEAHPLLVSLRNTGAPIEQYPLLHQFNHLIVYTEVDGQSLLLDAGSADRPAGLPRERALNHRGWVAEKGNPRWISLEVPPSRQITMLDVNVAESGLAEVVIKSRMQDYFAFNGRSALKQRESDAEAPLVPDLLKVMPEARVTSFAEEVVDDAPLNQFTYTLQATAPVGQPVDQLLYLQPILLPLVDGELADVEARNFPIDFPYPWQQRYIANLRLPAGYALEEAPDALRLRAADGSMTATYRVEEVAPGHVSVVYSVILDRTLYASSEYPALREMFRRITELQTSPLVFKKVP
ncbi:transglutaminase-like putative cysteine protease [Lewinella marina]|uniref:DUF3857 domain-containing protein n=1 Tax=Neolewinella marina TaxID=438751 RepID=A0A2G0CIF6_9BACT|nr:DUF3857 domain-containing protein [Neolewinella marina]NJB85125.1 transglutaminase-like putative cysteine protease [Neolewinella marina]PHK99738.1 hypothetical protein CGL56_01430 [Neolewinella marina]